VEVAERDAMEQVERCAMEKVSFARHKQRKSQISIGELAMVDKLVLRFLGDGFIYGYLNSEDRLESCPRVPSRANRLSCFQEAAITPEGITSRAFNSAHLTSILVETSSLRMGDDFGRSATSGRQDPKWRHRVA
jgi:hypothetical protein